MKCKCGLAIRYAGIVDGHSIYVHKEDGQRCEPDQDKTFERVEAMLPIWRERLLRESKRAR